MNITDVDDKIIKNAREKGLSLTDYTRKYETGVFSRMPPGCGWRSPKRSRAHRTHRRSCCALSSALPKRGTPIAAAARRISRLRAGTTTGSSRGSTRKASEPAPASTRTNTRKTMPAISRLWKACREDEPHWPGPFGAGRPGWHLECSAMAMQYLGETFDIHTGGVDLQFPHHENEIAQSEAATGKQFVRFWIHAEHLLVEGRKMSKSLGNFYTLRDLLEQGFSAEAVRYLLFSTPHRKQLNFTLDGLKGAAAAIDRLRSFKRRIAGGGFAAACLAADERAGRRRPRTIFRGARRRPQYRSSTGRGFRVHPRGEFSDRRRNVRTGKRGGSRPSPGAFRFDLRRARTAAGGPPCRPRRSNRGLPTARGPALPATSLERTAFATNSPLRA